MGRVNNNGEQGRNSTRLTDNNNGNFLGLPQWIGISQSSIFAFPNWYSEGTFHSSQSPRNWIKMWNGNQIFLQGEDISALRGLLTHAKTYCERSSSVMDYDNAFIRINKRDNCVALWGCKFETWSPDLESEKGSKLRFYYTRKYMNPWILDSSLRNLIEPSWNYSRRYYPAIMSSKRIIAEMNKQGLKCSSAQFSYRQ